MISKEYREFSVSRGEDGAWLASVYFEHDEDMRHAAFKSFSNAVNWMLSNVALEEYDSLDLLRVMTCRVDIYTVDRDQ